MGLTWAMIGIAINLIGACACLTVGAWLAGRRERFGLAGNSLVVALLMSALWCLSMAAGNNSSVSAICEALRDFAYLAGVYRLLAMDGRHASLAPVRPVLAALVFVELIQASTLLLANLASAQLTIMVHFHALFGLLEAIGALVLVHNLYVGASLQTRSVLRWPASAFALMWIYDLNLYTMAYLNNVWPEQLGGLSGLIGLGFAVILAIGAVRNRATLRLRPSRVMAFHTFSLMLIGSYMIAMVGITQWLAYVGGDMARWLQFGFLSVAGAVALLLLPSRQLQAWLRVSVLKHLFQHRYDYRAEWLRFTRTMSGDKQGEVSLHQRVIQALADVTDSPAGLLLSPDDEGTLRLAAHWQWPTALVPACALSVQGIEFLEQHGFIIELETVRAGKAQHGEAGVVPDWLLEDPCAWTLVPLVHYDRLVGAVVLALPPQIRSLDWEDFDLLRVIGQQLASYLSEHAGQEALAEAGRFDDFNRRMAFVMHDIKNLASQQSLLARNAELHADNPEFRKDMLVTLRNSAEKLNTLIARLSRYGGGASERLGPIAAEGTIHSVLARFQALHPVQLVEHSSCVISANAERLEQALVHLIQNAIDASPPAMPVLLSLRPEGLSAQIEITDSGTGMSAEFVRSKLFKPFESTKQGGFGIGAYEARELIRAMNGRLEVQSHLGVGTRFTVILPLATVLEFPSSEPQTQVA